MKGESAARILIIERIEAMRRVIEFTLKSEGFTTAEVEAAEAALTVAGGSQFDLAVVGSESFPRTEIATFKQTTRTPMVLLLGGDAREAVELCADGTVDDFLPVPFDPPELLSRVRFLLGDPQSGRITGTIELGTTEVDLRIRRLTVDGAVVILSDTEWGLLERLITSPNGVALSEEMLVKTWGPEYARDVAFLELWIDRLNRKLTSDPDEAPMILPFHSVGYHLTSDALRR